MVPDNIDWEIDDVVDLTKKLVSIPTESPEGANYPEFIDFLENEIKRRLPEFGTEKIRIPSEKYDRFPDYKSQMKADRIILYLRSPTRGKEVIHINGHYDVVSPGDLNKWTICPPYEPKLVDEKLYGRGAADMKGAIAAFIKSLELLRKTQKALHYDLEASFTPDEEIGIYGGVLYMTERSLKADPLIGGRFFLSLDGVQNKISIGKAGLINFEIKIKGKAVHSSHSFMGVNAIFSAIPVLQALKELKTTVEKRVSALPANPSFPFGYVRPNLNITLIKGGYAPHAIPDECLIFGDRMVPPDESEEPMMNARSEIVNCIWEIKQRHQIDLDFTVKEMIPGFSFSPEEEHIQRLRKAASEDGKGDFPVGCSLSFNDIAHVATKLGICTVSRGIQTDGCNVHSYDENIPIANLKVAVRDLYRFLGDGE
jgi:succinyl-diaminopimelate desuccinylase